jgi:hypothetical protein
MTDEAMADLPDPQRSIYASQWAARREKLGFGPEVYHRTVAPEFKALIRHHSFISGSIDKAKCAPLHMQIF